MKLKADLFPYPVLSRELDDYVESDFYTELAYSQISPSNVTITINFSLDNEMLTKLIKEGKACYAVHLEGVSSSFRKLYKLNSNESSIAINLNSDFVSRKIEVNTMIIANQDFESYYNEKFNSIYYGTDFSINKVYKGDILAFDTMVELLINFSNKENPNTKSMIRIAAKDQQYMSVDSDGEIIQVYLPKKAHTAYTNLSNSNEVKKNMLLVTVVLPALSYVINQIKHDEVEKDREWFIALKELLLKMKYDSNSIKTADSLKVAQELLDLPFENALYEFYQWEEHRDE